MVTRTWIGGGNNQASNPADWSPTGVPQPGDNLTMTGGTMNITGYNLDAAGDMVATGTNTINLSQGAVLDTYVNGQTTVNISGTDTLLVNPSQGGSATVNLAKNATWIGSFGSSGRGSASTITINGGPHSVFRNGFALDNAGYSYAEANAVINVDVIGTGNFDVYGGRMEFSHTVATGQTVTVHNDTSHSVLKLDQPTLFQGSTILGGGEIDLMSLARVDSYSFQNDMLSIFSGKKIIDTLKMHDSTQFGFEVDKTTSGVNIVAYSDSTHTTVGIPLSIHI